jgi:hypothetical protein
MWSRLVRVPNHAWIVRTTPDCSKLTARCQIAFKVFRNGQTGAVIPRMLHRNFLFDFPTEAELLSLKVRAALEQMIL